MFIREEAVISFTSCITLHPARIIGTGMNKVRNPFNLVKNRFLQGLCIEEVEGHILKIIEPVLGKAKSVIYVIIIGRKGFGFAVVDA